MDQDEMNFVGVALLVFCALASARGILSTITTVPLVGQALQVMGLVYVAQLAWKNWGRDKLREKAKAWMPTVKWPTL